MGFGKVVALGSSRLCFFAAHGTGHWRLADFTFAKRQRIKNWCLLLPTPETPPNVILPSCASKVKENFQSEGTFWSKVTPRLTNPT